MALDWLEFDFSEDAEGHGSFDAMAATDAAQWPALQAEVLRILDWAEAAFPGERGPLDDGGSWDCELQAVEEVATTLQVEVDPQRRGLVLQRGATGAPRTTLSFTIVGTPAFCDALRDAFAIG